MFLLERALFLCPTQWQLLEHALSASFSLQVINTSSPPSKTNHPNFLTELSKSLLKPLGCTEVSCLDGRVSTLGSLALPHTGRIWILKEALPIVFLWTFKNTLEQEILQHGCAMVSTQQYTNMHWLLAQQAGSWLLGRGSVCQEEGLDLDILLELERNYDKLCLRVCAIEKSGYPPWEIYIGGFVFFLPFICFSPKPSLIAWKTQVEAVVEGPALDFNGGTFCSSVPKGLWLQWVVIWDGINMSTCCAHCRPSWAQGLPGVFSWSFAFASHPGVCHIPSHKAQWEPGCAIGWEISAVALS